MFTVVISLNTPVNLVSWNFFKHAMIPKAIPEVFCWTLLCLITIMKSYRNPSKTSSTAYSVQL